MARGNPSQDRAAAKLAAQADKLHAKAEQLQSTIDRVSEQAKAHADHLQRWADRLESVELWMREEPGQRHARFTRSELARTAIGIVDAEGLDALSMRRLAQELGAGTMTLYHYVRTKDELLTLVADELMAEILLPNDYELPADWREALFDLAARTRDTMRRHPWVLDLTAEAGLGPNSVMHMDQALQAVQALDVPLATKLDVVAAVDEYVFGYCIEERNGWDTTADQRAAMSDYVEDLLATGDYPQLSRYVGELGVDAVWQAFEDNGNDTSRFERNLRRFIAGIAADLQ